jgi:hypothetical protein
MKKTIYTCLVSFQLMQVASNAQITPSDNVICMDVNQPQNPAYTYDSAFTNCMDIGMRQVGISFPWTNLETSPGVFDFSYLDIANVYYPAYNIPVDLTIAPINTNVKSVPSDLVSSNFDDPLMLSRFKKLLDSVFVHIPNLQLSSLVIGSEVDIYLGTNAVQWTQYTSFYSQVAAYAKTLRPSLKVTCEASLPGLTAAGPASYLQTLNSDSDYIGVSYYPLNSDFTVKSFSAMAADFAALIVAYPSKPVCFYQYGFPSASICNSSDNLQAQFITQTFTLWDTYAATIKMIDFTWMHDYSPAVVNYYATYYGVSDPAFLGFLGSLGLRTYAGNGINKPAFEEMICQANQRGYNSLTCLTKINGSDEHPLIFSVSPNPSNDCISITFNDNQWTCYDLKIINSLGQEVFSRQVKNNPESSVIDVSSLPSGIYFVLAKTAMQAIYGGKIIIEKKTI